MDEVLVDEDGAVATLTLNQPGKRNPLPYLPEHGLLPELERLGKDDGIRVVVITGAGKAFCSGLDLDGLKKLQQASRSENEIDSLRLCDFFETLRKFPKPIVAAVNGPAVAGGAGLALLADFLIASENASLRFSEVAIGFVPALVGAYLVSQSGERVARDLLLSARKISAQEAKELGLANEVVPADKLLERAKEVAFELAANSPQALAQTKALLNEIAGLPLTQALKSSQRANVDARETEDCKEGVSAFLEKRKPNWQAD